MKSFFTLALCVCTVLLHSQQINVWRFGQGAGLDFNSGSPVALPPSPIATTEAAASICDNQGQLLFYTDGVTVWNRNNVAMPNGTGLVGGNSATQALIVQKPGTCSQYYIFYSGDHLIGYNGAHYSIVDMCLNGGLGDVVAGSKNIQILTSCSEKWTAVQHANGTDVWVLCHELGNANFRKFILSPSGLSASTAQSIGSVHSNNCGVGALRASHNGQKLVSTNSFNCVQIDMFDFNNATGVLSNYVNLTSTIGSNFYYGIEFSPNDQVLYLSDCFVTSSLIQVNLANYATLTLGSVSGNYGFGGVQLGPDGKIYVARTGQNFISVINNPNTVGAGCGYVSTGVTLAAGSTSDLGLINFVPWYSTTPAPQYVSLGSDTALSCAGAITLLPNSLCNAAYLWSDASTGSTLNVNTPGTYWVQTTNVCGISSDTVVVGGASGNASAQFSTMGQAFCGSQIIFNNNSTGAASFLWNFGDNTTSTQTNPFHTYTTAGTYQITLIATGPCGTDTSFTTLVIGPSTVTAQFTSAGDTCGSPVTFTNTSAYATSYYWDFGDMTNSTAANPAHTYNTSGTYQVMLIADGPCDTDTTYVQITIVPGVVNAAFTSIPTSCIGTPVFFSNSTSGATIYSWDFGDMGSSSATSPAHTYTSAGTYTVTLIANGNCTGDTISHVITINPALTVGASNDTSICAGQWVTLTATGGGSYQWSGGSTDTTASISVAPATTTVYYVTTSNGFCTSPYDTVTVNVIPPPAISISAPTGVCLGDTLTLTAVGNASTYVWLGGATGTGPTVTDVPTGPANYYLIGTNSQGCSDTVMVTIGIYDPASVAILGNDTICVGESTSLFCPGTGTYIWSPATGLNSTTTQTVIATPTSSITYTLQVTDIHGCIGTDTFALEVEPCTGIAEVVSQNAFEVFPNPASNYLQITVYNRDALTIGLYNAQGELVYSEKKAVNAGSSVILDVSGLSAGIYLLRISGEQQAQTEPIIISE